MAVADAPLYLLRLLQYLPLMLLFGLPLLQWQADRAPGGAPAARLDDRVLRHWLLACVLTALATNMVEAPLKTLRIMWLPLSELDAGALAWYVLETPAGLAWLARTALLLAITGLVAGWPRARVLPIPALCALAGAALATLLWNGHAAASTGAAGALRLAVGGVHLLAAAAWLGAIAGFLLMLAPGRDRHGETATLRQWHALLHAFSATGALLVAAIAISGAVHYAWIDEWRISAATLSGTSYGRWMLFKLALFAAMLGLAALHRWVLVPRLVRGADGLVRLRRSLRLEAAAAVLIVAAVAVLGTMSPHG